MPLRKLFNVFRGSRVEDSAPQKTATTAAERAASSAAPSAAPTTAKSGSSPRPATVTAATSTSKTTAAVGQRSPRRGRSKLSRLVLSQITGGAQITSNGRMTVLEIGVGDGSRAIDVIDSLRHSGVAEIRYAAIDQFEAAGGTTPLMQFHRTLRSASIRPQVFPEPTEVGLGRLGRTIGGVDLILISASYCGDVAAIEPLLSRISHPSTVVVVGDGDRWQTWSLSRTDLADSSGLRAA